MLNVRNRLCDNTQACLKSVVVVTVVRFPSYALSCPFVSEEVFGVAEITVDCAFQKAWTV